MVEGQFCDTQTQYTRASSDQFYYTAANAGQHYLSTLGASLHGNENVEVDVRRNVI